VSVVLVIFKSKYANVSFSFPHSDSLKMLALERIRGKFFTRAWGYIKGAESIPVLISIPLTGFLNDASLTHGKAGYYICSALVAISGVLMFFIGYPKNTPNSKFSANG
jgi:hypothetical protein